MVSLKGGPGNGESGFRGVEFLPAVADVVGWVGLFLCVVGCLFLLAEDFAPMFGGYALMKLP
jgi:membrane-bound ClpP family serine protease